ncbi:Bile salt sulfotransferase 1 [Microtus ochrogaster]|uniref:Sulfotransferase n=1 Tax=Microtus ochrogaster TaxID=79684 RepID=A0A8J6FWJ0_MICOH|nr:Bile salt sulfotransferase 1 [Microtus ochrogaster]
MSQCPLIPPGVLMQSSLQRHSDHERILHPHVSPDPSTKPSLQFLRTGTAHPRHQIPLRSSVSSGCKGSQVPIASSVKCDDQQVHPEGPRKQREECTIYSKEQKFLLQRHFDQDKHPSLQKHMELALMIGVIEYEIKMIYVIRNPRDVLVSGYFFFHKTNLVNNSGSLIKYFEWFLKGNVVYGSWFEHTRAWLSMRERDNFLLLSYEDLKQDTRGTIEKICDFLGKKLEKDELDLVLKYSSFQVMKENKMSNFSILPENLMTNGLNLMRKGE